MQALNQGGPAPEQCTAEVLRLVLRQHLDAPCMLAIFPLQDLLPLSARVPHRPAPEETINDPTNPKHYWRYRMHVPLEELAGDAAFLRELHGMLAGALPQLRRACGWGGAGKRAAFQAAGGRRRHIAGGSASCNP